MGSRPSLSEARNFTYHQALPKIGTEIYFPEWFSKIAPQKLIPKGTIESYSVHSCLPQLLHKVDPKAAPQSCSPKAALELQRPKAAPKSAPESRPPKLLLKVATESCSPEFLKNVCPKAAVLQSKHSPKLFRKVVAAKSCSPKLLPVVLPKVAVQSCCPKAATLQTYTPKRLPKATLQSDSRKLLPQSRY